MKKIIYSLASLMLCAPLLASAVEAFVVADIGLQAGPDTEYPLIEELGAGTTVTVQGCIAGWSWCDVVVSNGDRGWVPGTFLEETYGGQRVVLIDYGARIGIPVVSFSLGSYWDRHYHSRPFYSQRPQWETRHIAVRTPPRPTGATTVARPTDTRTQQQPRERTSTTTPTRTAPSATPAPTPDRRSTEPSATAERTTRPEQRPAPPPTPQPDVKPKDTMPAPAKPTDTPPQLKPVEHPLRPEVKPEPPATAGKAQDEAKAKAREHEPKPKDELKAEKKKDDGGGGKR